MNEKKKKEIDSFDLLLLFVCLFHTFTREEI